jgi:acetyl esterase/lipase
MSPGQLELSWVEELLHVQNIANVSVMGHSAGGHEVSAIVVVGQMLRFRLFEPH